MKDVVIPKESVEQLLNQIDGLRLQIADKDYAAKGWDYLFNVKYDDGSTIQISLSGETVKIDGKVYKTALYKADNFATYFE